MKKGRLFRREGLFAALILAFLCSAGYADDYGPEELMRGVFSSPTSVTVSSPSYKQIAQFGKERTENLNRLLKHIGISVTLDGDLSETYLSLDGETVFSYVEKDAGSDMRTVYSFDPDTVYIRNRENGNGFTGFLEDHFFSLNRMLDDLYPVFERSAEAFSAFSKSSAANLNFRGYGKGVRKVTIALPTQYVSEQYPGVIAGLAGTKESRKFLEKLLFNGPQKIILLYDQSDRLLRINYDGEAGLTEDSMRKVSIVWRCTRGEDGKKDNLSLKTPAKKGYDKYNLTYERSIIPAETSGYTADWDLQIDLKEGEIKKKVSFTAALSEAENRLDGKIIFQEKQEGLETKITVIPALEKENNGVYGGTIEIASNSGKIVTSSVTAQVRLSTASEKPVMPGEPETKATGDTDLIQDRISSILIRKLLSLPAEDTLFFSTDIPADIWNSILQSY